MTNRDERPMFSDVSANGIDAEKQTCLLEIFESAMQSVSDTLVHEARFKTEDFAIAKEGGCGGFDLVMTRVNNDGQICWRGQFELGDQWLAVTGVSWIDTRQELNARELFQFRIANRF